MSSATIHISKSFGRACSNDALIAEKRMRAQKKECVKHNARAHSMRACSNDALIAEKRMHAQKKECAKHNARAHSMRVLNRCACSALAVCKFW